MIPRFLSRQIQSVPRCLKAALVYLVIPLLTMAMPLKAAPVSINTDILYTLLVAELAAARHMDSIALKNYLEVAEKTLDPGASEEATRLAIQLQAPREAVQSAMLWAQSSPNDLQPQLIVVTLVIGQSVEKAIPYLNRALEIAPLEFSQHIIEIQDRLSPGSAKNLRAALLEISQKRTNDPVAQLIAAESTGNLGDIKTANQLIDHALKLKPNFTEALELKTRLIRLESGSDKIAIAYIEDKLQQFPNNFEFRFFYASILFQTGDMEKAKQQFIKVSHDKKLQGQALLLLSEISIKQNKWQEAKNHLHKALEFPEVNDRAQLLLGEIAESQGNKNDAIQFYINVPPGPYHVQAILRAVSLLKARKAYQEAIDLIHDSSPTTIEEQKHLLLNEIDLLNLNQQADDALQLANDILIRVPNDADVLFIRAITATKLQKWEMAENDLKFILKENPDNASALNALGFVISYDKTRLIEASNYIVQALSIAPNNPNFIDSMGWIYFQQGDITQALTYLKKANALSDDAQIAAHLGEVLWVSNKQNEAKAIWQKSLNKFPNSIEIMSTLKRLQVELSQ